MKKALVRLFVVLGVLYLVSIVVSIFIIAGPKGRVPSRTILEADFEKPLVEDIPETPTAKVMLQDRSVLRDVVDAIGYFLRLCGSGLCGSRRSRVWWRR